MTSARPREEREERRSETEWKPAQQRAWRRFTRHSLSRIGGVILLLLFVLTLFAPFFAPYDHNRTRLSLAYVPPQPLRFIDEEGRFHLRPFVYAVEPDMHPETWQRIYSPDTSQRYPLYFFVRGWEYRLFGLFPSDLHLFGVEAPGAIFLLGTDKMGRDLLSRILYGGRVSITIALLGALASAFLGSLIGAVSGFYGGRLDSLIQRLIELILSFPTLPLFMALSVAIPVEAAPTTILAGMVAIFALLSWPVLAREIRGKVLSYREEDFVLAARAVGARDLYIIWRHLLPNVMSHVIVVLTVTVPELILAEGALSFLGLGVQPPLVSWGVMLRDATTLETIGQNWWIMLPGLAILVSVLAFNFVGDGLRDAIDASS